MRDSKKTMLVKNTRFLRIQFYVQFLDIKRATRHDTHQP